MSFVCPDCKVPLLRKENFSCEKCGVEWKLKDDVPVFFKDAPPYWCELSQDEAALMLKDCEENGWELGVKKYFTEEQVFFIKDESRINWRFNVEGTTEGKVLDAGCGWGTLALSFAKKGAEVWAFEPAWERVKFVETVARQENLDKLTAVCGDVQKLPFEDNFFDVVIFNGVVEWLGLSDESISADKVQERVLKEAYRVLKPGGTLYIGIENRLAYFYFLGAKDPHSGLRFVNLMPRFMANIYSKLLKKRKYSTYIYSIPGFTKLLSRVGFNDTKFYTPIPGYLNFKYIVPLYDIRQFRYWVDKFLAEKISFMSKRKQILWRIAVCIFKTPLGHLSKYFVPDYSIYAKK